MKHARLFLSFLLFSGVLALSTAALSAQTVAPKVKARPGVTVVAVLNRAGTYCHLKFPAIRPETLGSAKPQLQDSSSGDVIDFYGPCDHDPVGFDEVCKQRVQNRREQTCD